VAIALDLAKTREELAPLLDDPVVQRGLRCLAEDRFLLAFFLLGVSQGEALGEAGVAAIRQAEIARLLEGLEQQQHEERGHKEMTRDVVAEVFPEAFVDGRYPYEAALFGRPYYTSVLQANRARLRELGRYSRLNLYLTTTFAYEIMVELLYAAVAHAVSRASLPARVRERVGAVLERILREGATHVGLLAQHDALLRADRAELPAEAREMLEALARIGAEDYRWAADRAVREIAGWLRRYAEPARFRAEIEAAG
jgi:hypothetical protein